MGTDCAPLSDNNQADVNGSNSTSRYLDDLLNVDDPYFEQIVSQIYHTKLQENYFSTESPKKIILVLNPPFWNWTRA